MMTAVLTLVLFQQPAAADTAAGRPCQVAIDTVGHYGRQVEVRRGETNLFAGGGVRAHCQGTSSTLAADSVAWYAGVGRFDMLGAVHIRDAAIALDATTASYYLRQERLEAHKNVVATNRTTGSVLRGPNLTYYRAVRGVRDTAEMYATSRPTIEYRDAPPLPPDSGEPYLIVADRVRLKGNDRVWGGGSVTIDRSDLAAQGDSMMLDETAGAGVLVGKPQVRGKGPRSYRLTGRRIELGLQARDVRLIKALGAGDATSADWRLTADTIHLAVDRRKLQRVFAWGDSSRPHAVSRLHTIQADSLVLDVPDERLTEARAFGKARSTSKQDSSAAAAQDWMTGDTITAHWHASADSAAKPVLDQLVAKGTARAFTHLRNQRDSTTRAPSLNYTRGNVIAIALKGDRIDQVHAIGPADGLQLEPVPPPPPKDTTKRKNGRTTP